MHPLLKAVFFACLLMVTMTIAAGIGVALASTFCGMDLSGIAELKDGTLDLSVCGLQSLNASNQLFGFLGASLLFGVLFGWKSVNSFLMRTPAATVWLVPLLALFSFSLIQAAYEINVWLIPEGSWIANLAEPLEQQAEEMTMRMLEGMDLQGLFANLLFIAVLPAVCEEFVFRGVLQPLIAKITRNVHVGVWLSAILFSFIHLQFFGFIPRMLLGVFFGYLVVHMASLWPAILAHFLNNAAAVIAYYLANKGTIPEVDKLEQQSIDPVGLIVASVLFSLLFWVVLQRSKWGSIRQAYLGSPTLETLSVSAPQEEDPRDS